MVFRELLRSLADFVFPPRCLLCREHILSYNGLKCCEGCLGELFDGNAPACPVCGCAYESAAGAAHLCGRCITDRPCFDRARAIGPYAGSLRETIHQFKYKRQSLLAGPLGGLLAEYGVRSLKTRDYDLILPVPLHPRRLRQRGYNQSLMLARALARRWGVPVRPRALRRCRWTDPQTTLARKQRQKNVRGAFSYHGKRLDEKKVLVVDDVYTSGSTVNECARELKRRGAATVDVLTLARTA